MAMDSLIAHLGLFLSALGAATLLPLQSELVLTGLILSEQYALGGLVLIATLGNVLGAVINWGLGCSVERWQTKPWFPIKAHTLNRARQAYGRYGYWSLLLSWVPIIGDPLTLVAGVMQEPLWRFLVLVGSAKALRYLTLSWLATGYMG